MFRSQLLSVAFVVSVCLINVCMGDHCTKLLGQLADHQQNFVYCSTIHSENITICQSCNQKYNQTVESFNALVSDKICSEKFFDKDRINIVETIQKTLTGLWDKAYCQNCWENDNWELFDQKATKLVTCFNQYKTSVCQSCVFEYKDLNEFYVELDKTKHGRVCYDLQDSMNRTRYTWSHTYKCCKRFFDGDLFVLASCIITSIPVLFYAGLYAFNRYRELNPGLLEVEDPPQSAATMYNTIDAGVPDANNATATIGSSSSSSLAGGASDSDTLQRKKKLQQLLDASDDSDDESLA